MWTAPPQAGPAVHAAVSVPVMRCLGPGQHIRISGDLGDRGARQISLPPPPLRRWVKEEAMFGIVWLPPQVARCLRMRRAGPSGPGPSWTLTVHVFRTPGHLVGR